MMGGGGRKRQWCNGSNAKPGAVAFFIFILFCLGRKVKGVPSALEAQAA